MKNKLLHILKIIPNLKSGGAERLFCDLSNEIYENGHKLTLITFYDVKKDELFKEINPKIQIISLSKKKGFDFKLIFKLRSQIININPDIIHTHLRSINYVALSTFLTKYVIVHTEHTDVYKEVKSYKERFFRYIVYSFLKIYPIIISEKGRINFEHFYRFSKIKSKLIVNGRVRPKFKKKSYVQDVFNNLKKKFGKNLKIMINIGRIEYAKNHMLLNKAINNLNSLGYNVVVIVLGSIRGENCDDIYNEIKKNNNENFLLFGEVDNPADYLFLADYFVLSSIYEGMPISLIEAFACNCIPISTKVGGIPEMVDKDGFLSKSLRVDDFVYCMKEALDISNDIKQKIIKNNKIKYEEKYSISICANNYLNYYSHLIKK